MIHLQQLWCHIDEIFRESNHDSDIIFKIFYKNF